MKTVKDVQRAVENIQSLIHKLDGSITNANRYLTTGPNRGNLPYFLGSDYRNGELDDEFVKSLVKLLNQYRAAKAEKVAELQKFLNMLDGLVVGIGSSEKV